MSIIQPLKNRTIFQGDVLEKLAEIPNESIDCIISSPPYWGLRDYGVKGQWGLESDFKEYLAKMQDFMNELKRVLKKTGSCWINLGDTYAGGIAHSDWSGTDKNFDQKRENHGQFKSILKTQIQAKSKFGIPERFYINCIDNGWIARNHIPWYKSNSMPSSVKDRFTNKWESIFFFVKSQKYYFNLDAVREKTITESKPFNIRVRENITGHAQAKLGDKAWTASNEEKKKYNKDGTLKNEYLENKSSKYSNDKTSNGQRIGKFRNKQRLENKQDTTLGANGKPNPTYQGFNKRWASGAGFDENGNCLGCGEHYSKHTSSHDKNINNGKTAEYTPCNPKGKNPGDVFFINPKPFPEAHFATFPIDLPLKILKCACPEGGMVLDPFLGSGTVGEASEKLGLNWCGIELNPEYVKLIHQRVSQYQNDRLETFV